MRKDFDEKGAAPRALDVDADAIGRAHRLAVEDLFRRPLGGDAAFAEDEEVGRKARGEREVVHRRHRDDGAFAGDPADHFHHFELAADVEGARRFVEEKHIRLAHERLRDADELALATGKPVDLAQGEFFQPQVAKRVLDRGEILAARQQSAGAHALSRKEHGLEDRQGAAGVQVL